MLLLGPAAYHKSVAGCSSRTMFFPEGNNFFKSNFLMDMHLHVQG